MQEDILNRSLRDRAIDVEARAIAALGSASEAWEWLKQAKQEFDGVSARELMRTEGGLDLVEGTVARLEWTRSQYLGARSGKLAD